MYDSASTSGLTLLVGALAASVGLATLLLRWRNSIAKSQGKTPEQGRARFAASCVIEKGKAIGLGVECATCHTVYFIQQSTNRDRLYYCASPKSRTIVQAHRRTQAGFRQTAGRHEYGVLQATLHLRSTGILRQDGSKVVLRATRSLGTRSCRRRCDPIAGVLSV